MSQTFWQALSPKIRFSLAALLGGAMALAVVRENIAAFSGFAVAFYWFLEAQSK